MTVTVPDEERRSHYTPVVSTTDFAVEFPISAEGDVEVYLDSELVDPADYEVDLGELVDSFYSGAFVEFDVGVTGTVDIVGKRPPSRTGQFVEGARIPASRFNQEFNLLTMLMREAYDRLGRAFLVAPGGGTGEVPAFVAKAILKISDDGLRIEMGPDYTSTVATPGATGPTGPTGPAGATGATGPAGAGSGNVNGPGGSITTGRAVIWGADATTLAEAAAAPSLVGHTHAQADVTSLVSDLAAKIPLTAIGVTVQEHFGILQAQGDLTWAADKIFYGTSATAGALATLTAFSRGLLGGAAITDWRSNLAAAAKSQTAEALPFFIRTPANETQAYFWPYMPHAGTLTVHRTKLGVGTLTLQLLKNGVAWGDPIAVTTSLLATGDPMPLSLTFAAGDALGWQISSVAGSAASLSFMGTYTRALQ